MEYPLLLPPLSPYKGTRQIDGFGGGGFGAPRNGGRRKHKGLDFLGESGASAQFVMDARIHPPSGQAYADGTCDLRSIHLLGEGEYEGLRVTLLYVRPDIADGAHGKAGDPLGVLQDVAGYHMKKVGESRIMSNHCHFELYELVGGVWELRDPSQFLHIEGGIVA